MTNKEIQENIYDIFEEELLPILKAKGHDYAGTDNAFGNLADFGWQGIVVRISDKYHRLKNFCKNGDIKVTDETIEDTIKDLINYSLLCLLLKRTTEQSTPDVKGDKYHIGKKSE